MSGVELILSEQDEARLTGLLSQLCVAVRGRAAFLIDPHGRALAAAGETTGIDATSLAALAAGSLAAGDGLVRMVGEDGVLAIHHEGGTSDLYLWAAAESAILVVQFDRRSSLELVRLQARSFGREVARLFAEMAEGSAQDTGRRKEFQAERSQVSEADIDNLFTG